MLTFETDGGATVRFASEAAYDYASEWYHRSGKNEIVAWAAAHGLDLRAGDSTLRPGWADLAMELYAASGLTTTQKCGCCGGELPQEGSEAWEASEGTCPGHITEHGWCGAFDDDLAEDAEDDEDDEDDEEAR